MDGKEKKICGYCGVEYQDFDHQVGKPACRAAETHRLKAQIEQIKDAWEAWGVFCACQDGVTACEVCRFEALVNSVGSRRSPNHD